MTISADAGDHVDLELESKLTIDEYVGREVHHYLWEKRKTQTALAAELGLAQPNVSKRLRGETPWALSEIYTAARFLGVGVDELLPALDYQKYDQKPAAAEGSVRTREYQPRVVSLDERRQQRPLRLVRSAS